MPHEPPCPGSVLGARHSMGLQEKLLCDAGNTPRPFPISPACLLAFFNTAPSLLKLRERERIIPALEPRRENKPLVVQGIVSSR